jgi:DNA polymerase-3 subunit beta
MIRSWFTRVLLLLAISLVFLACNRAIDSQIGRAEPDATAAVETDSPPEPSKPDLEKHDDSSSTTRLPASKLVDAIRRTEFATGPTTSRYDLNGALFELRGSTVCLVATDAARMSIVELPSGIDLDDGGALRTFVSKEGLQIITSTLGGINDDCELTIGNEEIQVKAGEKLIRLPCPPVRFPDWRAMVPDINEMASASVDSNVLLASLEKASSPNQLSEAVFIWSFTKQMLCLSPESGGDDSRTVELPIEYGGDPVTLRLNSSFVVSYLRALSVDDRLTVYFKDEQSAMVLSSGDDHRYVLMPIAED